MKYIKLFEEFVAESQYDEQVNESFLVTALAAAAGVAGLFALVKTGTWVKAKAGDAAFLLARAAESKMKNDRLTQKTSLVDGIVAKFEDDEVLKSMYRELTPYSDKGKNTARTKQLKSIGEYIKAKLSEDELKYFVDISKSLRGMNELSES
jgi:hypothetical protein